MQIHATTTDPPIQGIGSHRAAPSPLIATTAQAKAKINARQSREAVMDWRVLGVMYYLIGNHKNQFVQKERKRGG